MKTRAISLLEKMGISHEVLNYKHDVKGAKYAADSLGVDIEQMIKSLVSVCNQNEENKLIISTHSPYVLATINNLILAKKVAKKYSKKVNAEIKKHLWLSHDDVFAGIVKDGCVKEIIDEDFDMIQMEQIDSVSRMINKEFDFLYQLETENDA